MFRAAVVLLASACACACARARPLPPPRHEASGGVAQCRLGGTIELNDGASLFASAGSGERGELVAKANGPPLGIAVDAIGSGPGARTHALLRDPGSGPALAIAGFLESWNVALYARRELPVAGDAIRVPSGDRVRVHAVRGPHLRVEAIWTELDEVIADADCDALSLERPARSRERPWPGRPFHLVRARARFLARPGGPLLLDVARDRLSATFHVDRSADEHHHVVRAQGLLLDAWMRASDLEPGEGGDCDDCFGVGDAIRDVADRCRPGDDADGGGDERCPEPLPPRAEAQRDVPVALAPGGSAVGTLERGAAVWVLEKTGGAARIVTVSGGLRPPPGRGFWVAAEALEPVTPPAAARTP